MADKWHEEEGKHLNDIEEKYKRLYRIEGSRQWMVIDEFTQQLCLRKEVDNYDLSVYEYLKNNRNPHVAAIMDYYEESGHLVVFEEYIQGRTLRNILDHSAPDKKEAKRIYIEILEGVKFLHHATPPIVHRDLKTTNVMISSDGVVKVIDYDASKEIRRMTDKDTVLMGTHGYAAPEQYGFAPSDERTDIYALGVIGKELLPKGYYKMLEKATRIDPERRYKSVDAMLSIINGRMGITNPLLPIPGFRSRKLWKMAVAAFSAYIWFRMTYEDIWKDETFHYRLSNIIAWTVIYPIVVDVWTDWTGLFEGLPLIKHPNAAVRAVLKTVYSIMALLMIEYAIRFFDVLAWIGLTGG